MSVPRESKTGKKKRKKFRPVHKGGKWGESGFLKTQEAVLHSEGGKLGMMDTRQRATAGGYVCIWTLREKKWPILTVIFCFFFLFFFFFDRPHQCLLCPPTPNPSGALDALWEMLQEPQRGGGGVSVEDGEGGRGGILTPKSEISAVALWAYTLCFSVSQRTYTLPGQLSYLETRRQT